jgi:hypothetical protein
VASIRPKESKGQGPGAKSNLSVAARPVNAGKLQSAHVLTVATIRLRAARAAHAA